MPTSPFNKPAVETPVETFTIGDRVTHDQYGLGSVVGIEDGIAVLVDFGARRVRILSPYGKLSLL
ncbi:MAG: hypothetical protein WAN48_14485 [Actinomycetes bacterium]